MTHDSDIPALVAKLSEADKAILEVLGPDDDFGYRSFEHAANESGLSVEAAKASIRALRGLGLTTFQYGLITDDGEMYGSGYALNRLGIAVLNHLQEKTDGQ